MNQEGKRQRTASEEAVALVRNEILEGRLQPEAKLKVQQLAKHYGIGTTPLREALTHLAAAGLVIQHGQRGFYVPELSKAGWADLNETRTIMETEAIRLAIQNADFTWEDHAVSSYHLFVLEIERLFCGEVSSIQKYWQRHTEFHQALFEACPLENLKSLLEIVYTRMIPYRRLTLRGEYSKSKLIDDHHRLLDDVLARRPESVNTIREHIESNAHVMSKALA